MRILAALFLLLASPCAHPQQVASAQTLTPQDARATLTVARAQATAAVEIATANAPTATTPATWTPIPTVTATSTPEPTQTPTPQPTNTATMLPTSTSAATATMVASATATQAPAVPQGEDITSQRWQVFGILLFCIAALGALLWFMRDRTFYIPRGDRHDDRK